MNKEQLEDYVRAENARLLTLVIDNPGFESYAFTSLFSAEKERIGGDYIAYDAYATMVFNMLATIFEYAPIGNYAETVSFFYDMLYFDEYVFMHRKWWEINNYAYDPSFQLFINNRLKRDLHFYWMQ